ncbi:hypothetical protein NOF04DRAFT_1331649 [Fusarium oxysporum II5]|nr:hypothetical protein NOF04DRAFT_1331649 [Fusarium oxysporum II5]
MRQTLLRSSILALIFNSNGLKPVISHEMPSTDWSTMFTSLHAFVKALRDAGSKPQFITAAIATNSIPIHC